ncbi:membrane-spanning 4-domains subfamily A member 4A-like [Mastacembelus armatus]|uniref:membrane-spanning 4-domains subfamily A member 4A-like n=1 Tax=Mastacembelus armatus TaxID=205130 RepID=UPI000E461BF8|nr:membrane-spanning 4-domains subfamily A member 4A-like [Mastacembelus armatus]
MTSTSVTTVGGVVVITQVIPQDESIRLHCDAPTEQAPPPPAPAKMDDMTTTFLRGEPRGLGVVQIFIGLLCILFSLTCVFSHYLILHAPFALAIVFVVSGSVVEAAGRRTSVGLVWASLVSNLFGAMSGLLGVAYVCWLLAGRPPSELLCGPRTMVYDERDRCSSNMWILDVLVFGLRGLLLVLLVLQVCVNITVCVFSGKSIRHRSRYHPAMVKVDDGRSLLSGVASDHGSTVTLLGSDGEECSVPPPKSP